MSHQNNTRILEDSYQDFQECIEKKDWKGARAIVDNLGDLGFENEAMTLHHLINRKQATMHRDYVRSSACVEYEEGLLNLRG